MLHQAGTTQAEEQEPNEAVEDAAEEVADAAKSVADDVAEAVQSGMEGASEVIDRSPLPHVHTRLRRTCPWAECLCAPLLPASCRALSLTRLSGQGNPAMACMLAIGFRCKSAGKLSQVALNRC